MIKGLYVAAILFAFTFCQDNSSDENISEDKLYSVPFDASVLPQRFTLLDGSQLFNILEPLSKRIKEIELKTKDLEIVYPSYDSLRESIWQHPIVGDLTLDSILFVTLDCHEIKFDEDKSEFEIQLIPQESSLFPPTGDVLTENIRYVKRYNDSYPIQNLELSNEEEVYNFLIIESRVSFPIRNLELTNEEEVDNFPIIDSHEKYLDPVFLKFGKENAPQIEQSLDVLAIIHVANPVYLRRNYNGKMYNNIFISVTAFWIYDSATREIYKKVSMYDKNYYDFFVKFDEEFKTNPMYMMNEYKR
jgi:hypothetical protein